MNLAIIVGSTRQNRITPRLAKWVATEAKNLENTSVEVIDLADYPMPFMDETISPRYNPNRVIDPAVQPWLEKLQQADAFVFVTPEYNHSIPGVLKNALDYGTFELVKKPATAVGHGTVGGARAIMHLKEILSESQAAIIPKSVSLAGASEKLNENGELDAELKAQQYGPQTALKSMLDELKWYSDALATARTA